MKEYRRVKLVEVVLSLPLYVSRYCGCLVDLKGAFCGNACYDTQGSEPGCQGQGCYRAGRSPRNRHREDRLSSFVLDNDSFHTRVLCYFFEPLNQFLWGDLEHFLLEPRLGSTRGAESRIGY